MSTPVDPMCPYTKHHPFVRCTMCELFVEVRADERRRVLAGE